MNWNVEVIWTKRKPEKEFDKRTKLVYTVQPIYMIMFGTARRLELRGGSDLEWIVNTGHLLVQATWIALIQTVVHVQIVWLLVQIEWLLLLLHEQLILDKARQTVFASYDQEHDDTDDDHEADDGTDHNGNDRFEDEAPKLVLVQLDDGLIFERERSDTPHV